MEQPLITIVVPVYNVEKYVVRCLESVENQTYTNIECLIIDDKSPDNSVEKIKEFLQRPLTKTFTLIHHPENLSLSESRNTGIKNSNGKYLYFLDSDDEIFPDAIENLTTVAEKTQAEMVCGDFYCTDEKTEAGKHKFRSRCEKDLVLGTENILQEYANGNYHVNACDKLVRKDFVTRNHLYFKKDLYSQDVLWNFLCALKLTSLAITKKPTYIYYYGNPNSIGNNRGKKSFDDWALILSIMAESYKKEPNKTIKKLIIIKMVNYKQNTLILNYRLRKDKKLWKYSYNLYKKIPTLKFKDFFTSTYPIQIKKLALYQQLPTEIGWRVFLFRSFRRFW